VFSACSLLNLGAAEFWQSQPFTEWSEKDLQKIMNNSPWAHSFTMPAGGPAGPDITAASGGGGRRGAPGAGADQDSAPAPISETNGAGRGGRGGESGIPLPSVGAQSVPIIARWQSALPLKQAFVRLKYGAEAATSEDAKELLGRAEPTYVIVLSGPMRPFLRGAPDELKEALTRATSLACKGKSAVQPTEVQVNAGAGTSEVIFSFPRTAAYTLDDKEVEFDTKLGNLALRYKFRLKDMVFNGKLEL
jgi:hypothetical protein